MATRPILGQPAPHLPSVSDARATAQRAFFEAALGRGSTQFGATSAPPEAAPANAVNPTAVAAPVDASPPGANARPGSLLNIVV